MQQINTSRADLSIMGHVLRLVNSPTGQWEGKAELLSVHPEANMRIVVRMREAIVEMKINVYVCIVTSLLVIISTAPSNDS